jgi:16S rRNA (adenine1518-N6/adenine1519-N6)-dimethyltransferase
MSESPDAAPRPHTAAPAHPVAALRALNRRADRRLSQSFLTQPEIARAMVAAAELGPGATVLEIGPGLGTVTQELVATGAEVVAIELDRALAEALPARLGCPANLRVVVGDALAVDYGELVREPYAMVASLPYHIASPLLFKCLFTPPWPTRIVAMVQLEVANRIVGRRRAMTFLGMAVATVAEARLVRRVAPGSFFPVPKVWSAIVRLDLRPAPAVPAEGVSGFVEFLRAGFAQPRKQLHNSLAQGLGIPPAEAQAAARAVGVDSLRRPGDLDLSEWSALYDRLRPTGLARWVPRP